MWILFEDLLSGGYCKEPWEHILVEASNIREAETRFSAFFHRDPNRITCPCCGEDYSIRECDVNKYAEIPTAILIRRFASD